MVFAALAFTLMMSAVKMARDELSAAEIIVWRALVALPVAAVLARGRSWRLGHRGVFALRLAFGFTAMVSLFAASKALSIADLSLIKKLQPLLIALGAGLILGRSERVGGKVWGALLLGLLGCAILIGPELAVGSVWGLWALFGAVAAAAAHICLRVLSKAEDGRVLVLWFQAGLVPLSTLFVVVTQGELPALPSQATLPMVVAAGLFATVGQLLLTKAYSLDQAARVAGAAYAGPVWAVAVDIVAFGTWPSLTAVVGGVIVIAAGFVQLRADRPTAS